MSNANAGFEPFDRKFLCRSARRGPGKVLILSRLMVLSAAVTGFSTFGCGTPHATFDVVAPSQVTSGAPFTITVTAMLGASRDRAINSSIRFTSSDSAAVLPPDYYFTASDEGSHTFTNGVVLMTAGSQTITATDIGAPGLNGTANVTVSTTTAMQTSASAPSSSFQLP